MAKDLLNAEDKEEFLKEQGLKLMEGKVPE